MQIVSNCRYNSDTSFVTGFYILPLGLFTQRKQLPPVARIVSLIRHVEHKNDLLEIIVEDVVASIVV